MNKKEVSVQEAEVDNILQDPSKREIICLRLGLVISNGTSTTVDSTS